MNVNEIGAAVVGAGFMGPAPTEALRRLGVLVRGILGSSPEKSKRAAEALGLPRAYRTYAEVLEDPSVQAVHVAPPNRLHRNHETRGGSEVKG